MGPSEQVTVAVLGASGFAGAELLRLLGGHAGASVVAAGADSASGRAVGDVYPHLSSLHGDLALERLRPGDVADRARAAFLALPHGASMAMVPALAEAGLRVIDLGGDFRLPAEDYPTWYGFDHAASAWLGKAAYGLPELFPDEIRGSQLVAGPGCYPTPAILGLVPLVRAALVEPDRLVIDAKSGVSGAGRAPTEVTHFAHAEGSVRPYRAGGVHQHTPEIERVLEAATARPASVTFVPHLVPTTRGVLVTCYAPATLGAGTADLLAALAEAYAAAPFVRILPEGGLPDTKRVTGANVVELGAAVDPRTGTAIVVGAIDNLIKGAAGQAVQCFNLMFGFPETSGLEAVAVYP